MKTKPSLKDTSPAIKMEEFKEDRQVKTYLKKELSDVLVEALAACARAKPENPTLFVSEFLKNHA